MTGGSFEQRLVDQVAARLAEQVADPEPDRGTGDLYVVARLLTLTALVHGAPPGEGEPVDTVVCPAESAGPALFGALPHEAGATVIHVPTVALDPAAASMPVTVHNMPFAGLVWLARRPGQRFMIEAWSPARPASVRWSGWVFTPHVMDLDDVCLGVGCRAVTVTGQLGCDADGRFCTVQLTDQPAPLPALA